MSEPRQSTLQLRVQERMMALGKKPAPLATSLGYGDSFIRDIVRKGVMPGAARLAALAGALETTPDYLLGKTDEVSGPATVVPLKGYIGAGGEVLAEEFGGDETVEAPAESNASTVAARVKGTSMYPTFQDGWLIYWSRQLPPGDLVNTIVVAQLEDERIMVKTIMPGSKPGLWNLVSVNVNTPPMLDQAVRWVAPIDWIRPR